MATARRLGIPALALGFALFALQACGSFGSSDAAVADASIDVDPPDAPVVQGADAASNAAPDDTEAGVIFLWTGCSSPRSTRTRTA